MKRSKSSDRPDGDRAGAEAETARKKAEDERRKRNDRRESDERRREPRVLVDTGEKRPDRRNGPRRTSE